MGRVGILKRDSCYERGGRKKTFEGLLGSGEGPFEARVCDFIALSVCTVL